MSVQNEEKLKSRLTEIPRSSPLYPAEWKALPDAPEALYALGNTALLQEKKFTVVGSRRTSAQALKLGESITKELSRHFVIVTGTAEGGDSAAAEGGLENGRVICVLAGGFSALPQANLPLLRQVAKKGLLLSPHPFETEVRNFSYEYRNKLLAALGEGVFVLGAGEKSGALITARYAKEWKKPIFAFPYPPNAAAGAGCNRLLKDGGYLTENAEDIFSKIGIDKETQKSAMPKPTLSADEEKMYSALCEQGEGHVNELSVKSGVPVFKARAVLSSLEVKGLAVGLGGNRYGAV